MLADPEQLTSPCLTFPGLALGERWDVAVSDTGTIVLRALSKRLRWDELLGVAQRLREVELDGFQELRFDFSPVMELVGPWGVHFAILIQLADEIPGRVCVTGLNGQPAALAWLFRNSQSVRKLIIDRAARNGEVFEDMPSRKVA